MTINGVRALILAGLGAVAVSSHASAQDLPLRYLPPLETSGGAFNPGVIVAFNPQPDPPGIPTLDLSDRYRPLLTQPGGPGTYLFVMSFTGLPGLLLPAVQSPNADGVTDFTFDYGGHAFDVGIAFFGPGAISNWVSFNPQPDPPGIWFADAITFAGVGDPRVSFTITEDGSRLAFSTPELSTWALMGLGFAALGVLAYRRGARSSDFISRA